MDDHPRRDSVIFNVNVWHAQGPAPSSIWQVLGRQKNIQYASRADSHIARQKQLHRMRHIIRKLNHRLPPEARDDPELGDLTAHGCGTTMHVVRLQAPEFDGDDYTKDIDFTPAGIAERREAGYRDARSMLGRSPWLAPVDPMEGVIVHQDMPMSARLAKS
jgi:NTE family protein